MTILQSIHNYDVHTFTWCLQRLSKTVFVPISRLISRSADGYLYPLVGAFFIYLRNWEAAALFIVGIFIERSCYFTFKSLFRRNRPREAIPGFDSVIEPSDQFSFPSGHTSASFFVVTLIALSFPWAAWFLYPWAILVGMSRVILGVHFPTDVLAGAVMGYGVCMATAGVLF